MSIGHPQYMSFWLSDWGNVVDNYTACHNSRSRLVKIVNLRNGEIKSQVFLSYKKDKSDYRYKFKGTIFS